MVCWEKRGCGCAKCGHGLKEHEENSSGFSPLQRGSLPYGEKCYGCAFHPQPKIISELLGGREPGGGRGISLLRLQLIMRNAFLPSPPLAIAGAGPAPGDTQCEAQTSTALLVLQTDILQAKIGCWCLRPIAALIPAPSHVARGK